MVLTNATNIEDHGPGSVSDEKFDHVFNLLDPSLSGHVTFKEFQDFHQAVFFSHIAEDQVKASIEQVCGVEARGNCRREHFQAVLVEMERRKEVERKAYWDFLSLDHQGRQTVSIKDALFLFKVTHGDLFSMSFWRRFLASRDHSHKEACWLELRMWLCAIPTGSPSDDNEYLEMDMELTVQKKEQDTKIYNQYKELQMESEKDSKYRSEFKKGAQQRQKRWEQGGVDFLLNETDQQPELVNARNRVTVTEILEFLEDKYEYVRVRLFKELLRMKMGAGVWSSMSESEQQELVRELHDQERGLRKRQQRPDWAEYQEGLRRLELAGLEQGYRLLGVMGQTLQQHQQQQQEARLRRTELQGAGKTTQEINQLFYQEFLVLTEGTATSDQILLSLYQRYTSERDYLLARMRGDSKYTFTKVEMITEYLKLVQQKFFFKREVTFRDGCMALGLGERPQTLKSSKFDGDRILQETLAGERISQFRGRKALKRDLRDFILGSDRDKGIVDLQIEISRIMENKHAYEREVIYSMLQGRDMSLGLQSARRMDREGRERGLARLQGQYQDLLKMRRSTVTLSRQSKVIQEALALYHENRREEVKNGHNLKDEDVSKHVLADLQQRHSRQMWYTLVEMQNKGVQELIEMRRKEEESYNNEHLDNISAILLGTLELSEEEKEVIATVEKKYDAIRRVLLSECLKTEHGEKAWEAMSLEDKLREIVRKEKEERKLRQEAKADKLGFLISEILRDLSIHKLMGLERGRYGSRVKERLALMEQRELEGMEYTDHSSVEEGVQITSTNLLVDLQRRCEEEVQSVIALMQGEETGARMSDQERCRLVERINFLEVRRIEREGGDFKISSSVVGLAERALLAIDFKNIDDRKRHLEVAQVRMDKRTKHIARGLYDEEELNDHKVPGTLVDWRRSIVEEVHKKHGAERVVLLATLTDPGSEDLREVAQNMSQDESHQRLATLRAKRDHLDLDNKDDQEENQDILEESGAIKSVLRYQNLVEQCAASQEIHDRVVTHDRVVVSLLADLQQLQDRELERVFQKIGIQEEDELSRLRREQISERQQGLCTNVLEVFTRFEGVGDENELMKALKKKYDALRDKLLMEGLKKQYSEAEWARMTEKERQNLLIQLKLEERRLNREGRLDEAALLIEKNISVQANLKNLMGENRARYEEKLRERLERRRNMDPDEIESDEEGIEEDEDSEGKGRRNVLSDLQGRYDEECEELLRRLRSLDDDFLSEQERQRELARLKREYRRAQREDVFDAAALVVGLAERNQAAEARLKRDRERQEELARQRHLVALRRKRAAGRAQKEELSVLNNADRAAMQDALLKIVEKKHELEREELLELLQKENWGLRQSVELLTPEQRQQRLDQINTQRKQFDPTSDDYKKLLEEAAVIKFISRKLTLERDNETEITEDETIVAIMADLQQQQDKESEQLIRLLPQKDLKELVMLQELHIKEYNLEQMENVIIVLITPEKIKKTGERELLEALQGKYDALKDKLFAEALLKQHGEAEWAQMSEKERQAKILKLRLQEKKLRQEGQYEEAAALLAGALSDKETLDTLMGQSKAEYEKSLKERLARRQQRLLEGMSEDEVNQLEEEEIEQEEEEMKKRRKNILEELDRRYDDERDELLANLRGQDERYASERLRQAELAKLRREQMRARREDKFDAAALVMGLARQHDEAKEKERLRQEKLARERLEQRRRRKGSPSQLLEEVAMPEDENDVVAMQEVVLKEMELKHMAERELLIQLIQEQEDSDYRRQAQSLESERRLERLEELREMRSQWREAGSVEMAETAEEQMDIFMEATALMLELRLAKLREEKGGEGDVTQTDVGASILADLQQEQDKENDFLVNDLHKKSVATLKQLKIVQKMARTEGWNDNVANALLNEGEGDLTEEQQVVKALEQKYDALRDKLLAEALLKEMGEAEWLSMSEKERQMKLVKLKLQEKRLRQEGKLDEAAAILGQNLLNQAELAKILGDTKATQQARLKERLERKKQIKEEREALGLSTDDSTIEKLVEIEEEIEEKEGVAKRKNVLENLNNHFEEEKEALLALLKSQNDRFAMERQRQLAIAKLKRDQRKLKEEEKFDGAALVFALAKQNETAREASLAKSKEQQRQLAKERLAAAKKQRALKKEALSKQAIEEQLRQDEEEDKQLRALQKSGESELVQEAILSEMEKKHKIERNVLIQLMQVTENKPDALLKARGLSNEELESELVKLSQVRDQWKKESVKADNNANVKTMTPEELSQNIERSARSQAEQNEILKLAAVFKIEVVRRAIVDKGKNIPGDKLKEEVGIALMTDLQTKQFAESNAMSNIVNQKKNKGIFQTLRNEQKKSRREGWLENLVKTVLDTAAPNITDPDSVSLTSSDAHDIQEQEKLMLEIDDELERKKNDIKGNKRKSLGENIDAEAMLAQLEKQHATKKQVMQEQLENQKKKAREKLMARRQKQESKDYENELAVSLVKNAEKAKLASKQKNTAEKDRQGDMMKQKLADRRKQRQKQSDDRAEAERQMEIEKEKQKQEEEQKKMEETLGREGKAGTDSPSQPNSGTNSMTSSVGDMSLPGLRREKTVIDVKVSEEQEKQILSKLEKDQTRVFKKIEQDQQKQQEALKERIRQRKFKHHDEAAAIIGKSERDKTVSEKTKQDERDRQITMIRDRVDRARYQRTMTMKEKGSQNVKGFKDLLEPSERALSENEQMKLIAERMQLRLLQEEGEVKSGSKLDILQEIAEDQDEQPMATSGAANAKKSRLEPKNTSSSKKLKTKDKERILKERMAAKKKQKISQEGQENGQIPD